jgi:hypothetical protein
VPSSLFHVFFTQAEALNQLKRHVARVENEFPSHKVVGIAIGRWFPESLSEMARNLGFLCGTESGTDITIQ